MNKSNATILITIILFTFILICMIIYPSDTFDASLEGLNLWFNSVCPALLPFFICIEILIGLGFVDFIGEIFKPLMKPLFNIPGVASFTLLMSFSSGYPVGARITAKLRSDKTITKLEGQRMLSLCSSSGPLFIVGAVATSIMKNPEMGLLLVISHYLSAITVGFIMRFYGKSEPNTNSKNITIHPIKALLNQRKKDGRSIGALIGDSVKTSVAIILNIGGFIIFFSVIASVLNTSGVLPGITNLIHIIIPIKRITDQIISSLLIGLLEITNGVNACSLIQGSEIIKMCIISFIIGFGGISINTQVLSIISETDLRFDIYLFMKIVQGFAASCITYLGYINFYNLPIFKNAVSAFNNSFNYKNTYNQIIHYSIQNLLLSLMLLFILGILFYIYIISYRKITKKQET